MGDLLTLLDSFISQYVREFDFYEQTARIAARLLEVELQAEGIRCIVTSRAKSVTRLEDKVRRRNSKLPYESIESIYADIVDLAGVRVALYFPAEREQVAGVVGRLFTEYSPRKVFPDDADLPVKDKRFSGYSAVHYRVRLLPSAVNESERRYSSANIEVQVASVLMHAWSEVEHDLVYKPFEGKLSDEEYALLDQLNGLVLAGEISLERLQKAGESRVAQVGRRFANHYELAAHLLSLAATLADHPVTDAGVGRVDLLYDLLVRLELDTPGALESYLESLHGDLERRPLAQQIIDALLAEDPSRYETYQNVRAEANARRGDQSRSESAYDEMGRFIMRWVRFERLVRSLVPESDQRRPMILNRRTLEQLEFMNPEAILEIDHIRRIRNEAVHGIKVFPPGYLLAAAEHLETLIAQIEEHGDGEMPAS